MSANAPRIGVTLAQDGRSRPVAGTSAPDPADGDTAAKSAAPCRDAHQLSLSHAETVGTANRLARTGSAHRAAQPCQGSVTERGGAALLCFRTGGGEGSTRMTWWTDFSMALEADAQRTPCGESCREDHAIVYRDNDSCLRTVQVRRPLVDEVRRELRAAALNGDGLALARLRDNLKHTRSNS